MSSTLRMLAVAGALALGLSVAGPSEASAQDYCGPSSRPDLFYNYYVGPVPCGAYGAAGAQLYVSPRPVPPFVGHTYITYEPLLPHEFLYKHRRTYQRYHGPHGGVTTTHVRWH